MALAPYVPIFLLILGGMGWLLKYLLSSKDQQIGTCEERLKRSEGESEALYGRLLSRTEEAMENRAKNAYLKQQLDDCLRRTGRTP